MSKLNINTFDTKDLITQTNSLNNAMRKEAQIARIALTQGMMPVFFRGSAGDFVMLSDGEKKVYFRSKTMDEGSFVAGLKQVGQAVGYTESDIVETYNHDSIAMALCNDIQKETINNLTARTPKEFNEIVSYIEARVDQFAEEARNAKVHPGVIFAVVTQIKNDLNAARKVVAAKEEESANAK